MDENKDQQSQSVNQAPQIQPESVQVNQPQPEVTVSSQPPVVTAMSETQPSEPVLSNPALSKDPPQDASAQNRPQKPETMGHKWMMIVLILIVVLVMGFILYIVLFAKPGQNTVNNLSLNVPSTSAPTSTPVLLQEEQDTDAVTVDDAEADLQQIDQDLAEL